MSESVQMPPLGESVTEGTVTRWLKREGERVEADEPLLEVSTDKVDTEIPSPVSGVVEQILVAEDETVQVGAELVRISTQAAAPATFGSAPPPTSAPVSAPPPTSAPVSAPPPTSAPVSAPPPPAPPAGPAPTATGASESVRMPPLGESVTEGTVTRWLKREGERVEADEPLLEVSTDKVDTEIPSPVSGVVEQILVAEDETVQVGAELVRISTQAAAPATFGSAPPPTSAPVSAPPPTSAPAPAPAPAPASAPPPAPAPAPAPAYAPPSAPPTGPPPTTSGASTPRPTAPRPGPSVTNSPRTIPLDGNAYVTPLVRRLAAEHGIDLSAVVGTGVGGRIRKQDVLDAVTKKPTAPAHTPHTVSSLRGTREPMPRLRKVIAARLVESLQTTAQLTTVVEADLTRVAQLREQIRPRFEAAGIKPSYLAFFALAAVEALQQYPVLNASIEGDEIVYHGQENLGIAVDTDRGLLVPVIHQAADLTVADLARTIADLAERTRSNRINPDELGGGTFTVTNTGSRGALFDTPILFPPQVGILGTGSVVRRPTVLVDDEGEESIGIRSIVNLALSYDHRLVDGADAARFLTTIKTRLEEGAFDTVLGL